MLMSIREASIKWALSIIALFGVLILSFLLYKTSVKQTAFLTTSSPARTYTVYLTGQKQRPLFFTVEVRFNVLKNGDSFLANKYLHSGDSGDLSFEAGYPNHRWINENTIQFYREQYFNDGKPDTLVVLNHTNKTIKYIRIESVDKFLLFDLQAGSTTNMLNSRPRGDSKWLRVGGEFSDGRSIVGNDVTLPVRRELRGSPITYYIEVNDDRTTFGARD
jgi:hypothetical protein